MDENINIAGFDTMLIRKAVKYLRISVSKGAVKVTAPRRLSIREIESLVSQKSDWIKMQLARAARIAPERPESYADGETLRLWGEYYTVKFDAGMRGRFQTDGDVIRIKAGGDERSRKSAVMGLLRRETVRAAEARLPLWEKATGLKCSAVCVRDMTSRWGTCNTQTGKLTFSVRLAQKPPECLDYIIIHELCHLSVKNHGADFKALMDKFYPRWRDVRKLLAARG